MCLSSPHWQVGAKEVQGVPRKAEVLMPEEQDRVKETERKSSASQQTQRG